MKPECTDFKFNINVHGLLENTNLEQYLNLVLVEAIKYCFNEPFSSNSCKLTME